MDGLIKQALSADPEARRLRIYRQIQQLAARDAPIIPVWQGDMIAPARRNIGGIPGTLDATFIMRFWRLTKS